MRSDLLAGQSIVILSRCKIDHGVVSMRGRATALTMTMPTFQQLQSRVLQTFKAPARFLPLSVAYSSASEDSLQRLVVRRDSYLAHPQIDLALAKELRKEPELSLTVAYTDTLIAPSICIYPDDWRSDKTFEVVCFEPELTQDLQYIRWGLLKCQAMQDADGVFGYRQVDKLLKGKASMLNLAPFQAAAALFIDLLNSEFRHLIWYRNSGSFFIVPVRLQFPTHIYHTRGICQ